MIKKWKIEFVNKNAEKEIFELTSDLKAKFLHIGDLLKEFGPFHVGMPHVRLLQEKLWEMRLKGNNTIARSIYILATRQRIIILHTFIKKTRTTPLQALRIAQSRTKEIKDE